MHAVQEEKDDKGVALGFDGLQSLDGSARWREGIKKGFSGKFF
jgi:hypothetical protein